MNNEFEAIIMNTYAELCIMWRVAHVTDQAQAEDFDTKLKSLEAVVAAFELTTPALDDSSPAEAAPAVDEMADPTPARQTTPEAKPADSGLVFGD